MKNNEIKNYKGAEIKKVNGKTWTLNGRVVAGYDEAKKLVDFEEAEYRALKEIDNYVVESIGWL